MSPHSPQTSAQSTAQIQTSSTQPVSPHPQSDNQPLQSCSQHQAPEMPSHPMSNVCETGRLPRSAHPHPLLHAREVLPTNWTLLTILLCVIGYNILQTNNGSFDNDMWWLLATGREIVENGIPYTNPWAMFDGLDTVIQQWLSAVVLYGTYACSGFMGLKFLVFAQCVLLAVVLFGVCRIISGRRSGSAEMFGIAIAVGFYSYGAYLSVRPHVYSMIMYAVVVGVMEMYRRTNNARWLIALPVITCLHVNLHAAMAPFDLGIIALYAVPNIPAILRVRGHNVSVNFFAADYRRLPVLVALMVAALALLVNPYGVKGAVYVALSYGTANYGNYINEMGSTGFWTTYGGATMAMIVLGAIAVGRNGIRRLDVPLTCLFLVCIPASMMHTRNVWLVALFAVFIFTRAMSNVSLNNSALKKFVSNKAFHVSFIVVIALVATGYFASSKWTETVNTAGQDSANTPALAADYLDTYVAETGVDKQSLRICNSFNNGGYLEWRGYKVFMDARPELWEPNITGVEKHYFQEFVNTSKGVENSKSMVSEYNFDFCIAYANSDLETHLKSNSNYKKVLTCVGYTMWARADLDASDSLINSTGSVGSVDVVRNANAVGANGDSADVNGKNTGNTNTNDGNVGSASISDKDSENAISGRLSV